MDEIKVGDYIFSLPNTEPKDWAGLVLRVTEVSGHSGYYADTVSERGRYFYPSEVRKATPEEILTAKLMGEI